MVLRKVDIVELDRQESILESLKTSLMEQEIQDLQGYELTGENLKELRLKEKHKHFIQNNWKMSKK